MRVIVPISVGGWARLFTRWELLAILLILGLLAFLAEASRHLLQPLAELQQQPLSLDPAHLPEYAARTTLRILIALGVSLLFTFTYATLAAKNKQAERLLVPLLDILQSVPILGFISITVVFFMALAPGRVLGAEFAAIFAIFTSQAWNMAFSFYQSLRTVPAELVEASRSFRLSPWMNFWRVDVPFAMPQLIWNMMMSMSGSWFFVVASEVISVGNTTVTLPGVGSYIALAIAQRDLAAVGYAIRHHARRHPHLRPGAVPAAGGVGRPLPLRAGGRRPAAAVVDARRPAPLAAGRPPDAPFSVLWARSMRARWFDRGGAYKQAARDEGGWAPLILNGVGNRARRRRALAGRALCHHRRKPRRRRHDVPARPRHLVPRRRADRHRQLHLGAGRRLGRHPAARRQSGAAGGAIPRRLSGEPSVPDRGLGHRRAQTQTPTSGSAR